MSKQFSHDTYASKVQDIVSNLLTILPSCEFAIRFPDGTVIHPSSNIPPRFTIILKNPGALRRMLLPLNELGLGEGYILDDYDIDGNMLDVLDFFHSLQVRKPSLRNLIKLSWQLLELENLSKIGRREVSKLAFKPFRTSSLLSSTKRDRDAIKFHYDLSNEFFKLWLDERMVYSCGYFTNESESLEQAQLNKFALICRMLDLRKGEKLLDIGCGWGGLAIYAAENYDVEVVGITLSASQRDEAVRRASAAGLSDRCHIYLTDYQQYTHNTLFDKIVSVGMVEHIGQRIGNYFQKAYCLLERGGLFLLQGGTARINRSHFRSGWVERVGWGGSTLVQKYFFPNSHLVTIPHLLKSAESTGFELLSMQSFTQHYPLTLSHWLSRLEHHKAEVIAEVGEAVYRCWRLMMSGYMYQIKKKHLVEDQFLFHKF